MSSDTAAHIPEERILRIVAEGRGMRPAENAHLQHCGHCRAMLRELEEDLQRFRQQALAAAPAPGRRFVLPADGPARNPLRRLRWGWAALGTVLSAALVVLFLQLGPEKPLPGLPTKTRPLAGWKDPEMVEVNRLAENPLPEAYLALSESLEGGYDEAFIDFLIPPLDDEPVS